MSKLEELKRLEEHLRENAGGLKSPFPFVVVNYDEEVGAAGTFAIGGEKKNGEWITPPTVMERLEFVLLKERGQYTYYNEHLNRLTVKSTILPRFQMKQAVDLVSGEPIEKLRREGLKLTYNSYLLVLIRLGGGFAPAIFKLKGATLKSWIDFTKRKLPGLTDLVIATTQREKKGTVKYFTLSLDIRDITEDEAGAILPLIQPTVDAFEEWVFHYNNRHITPTEPQQTELQQPEVFGGEEDEIPF